MSAKKTSMTATELLEMLKKDKQYQEKRKKRDLEIEKFKKLLHEDSLPLIQALEKVGVQVKSVWDLVNTQKSYSEAIPVLIDHLSKSYHLRTKAGIARALAVKESIGIAWDTLIDEYRKAIPDEKIQDANKKGYKEGLASTISFLADRSTCETILTLIQEKEHGASRVFFVDNLFKWRSDKKVLEVVESLKNDKDVSAAIKEIFKLK